jgi:hypothetical protein
MSRPGTINWASFAKRYVGLTTWADKRVQDSAKAISNKNIHI